MIKQDFLVDAVIGGHARARSLFLYAIAIRRSSYQEGSTRSSPELQEMEGH